MEQVPPPEPIFLMPLLNETNDILKYLFLTVTHKGGRITSSDSSTGFADACTLSDAPSTDLHSKF